MARYLGDPDSDDALIIAIKEDRPVDEGVLSFKNMLPATDCATINQAANSVVYGTRYATIAMVFQ